MVAVVVYFAIIDRLKKRHQQKDGTGKSVSWFAHTAATWILEKAKERKFLKVQARKETVHDATVTLGDAVTMKNDLAIFDCLRYFRTQGGVALVSYDTLLCTNVVANGTQMSLS